MKNDTDRLLDDIHDHIERREDKIAALESKIEKLEEDLADALDDVEELNLVNEGLKQELKDMKDARGV